MARLLTAPEVVEIAVTAFVVQTPAAAVAGHSALSGDGLSNRRRGITLDWLSKEGLQRGSKIEAVVGLLDA